MTFAVVGAGAIGGLLGARLAMAGEKVTFVARGANLEAIRQNGFTLIEEDGMERRAACGAAAIGEAGPHDFVLLALKAHQVTAVAKDLRGYSTPAPLPSRSRTACPGGISISLKARSKAGR